MSVVDSQGKDLHNNVAGVAKWKIDIRCPPKPLYILHVCGVCRHNECNCADSLLEFWADKFQLLRKLVRMHRRNFVNKVKMPKSRCADRCTSEGRKEGGHVRSVCVCVCVSPTFTAIISKFRRIW